MIATSAQTLPRYSELSEITRKEPCDEDGRLQDASCATCVLITGTYQGRTVEVVYDITPRSLVGLIKKGNPDPKPLTIVE